MVDYINIDIRLLLGILTPTLLAIGYFYRARKENIRNRKAALYILLKIWHGVSTFYRRDFDDAFDQMVDEIKSQFPEEIIQQGEIEAAKKHFTPILIENVRKLALSDLADYQDQYQEAVSLMSSDDPVFAYKISTASKTNNLLKLLESYLDKSLAPIEKSETGIELSKFLKSHATKYAEIDSIKDLEENIKKLSYKIGILTYVRSVIVIRRRKSRLKKIDNEYIKKLVKEALIPVMKSFNQL